ncbi:MAG: HU family DNA-binding protein [Chromatiales bacterium]|nr:HU family DNA-binding protein [Chromatiales bacterium]
MVAKKKAAAKKAVKKKVVAKKAAPKKAAAPKKLTAVKEPMSKSQLYATISERTDVSKKEVAAVFDALSDIVDAHVNKRAAGSFTLPGLLKITTVKKPAKKARKGINPFTGEETMFKAKPASIQVKVRPLKKLKDFASN